MLLFVGNQFSIIKYTSSFSNVYLDIKVGYVFLHSLLLYKAVVKIEISQLFWFLTVFSVFVDTKYKCGCLFSYTRR